MTPRRDLDRALLDWFEAEAQAPPPADRLDRILDATRHRSPMPWWLARSGSQWVESGLGTPAIALPAMVRPALVLMLLVALVAMIVVGAALSQPSPGPTMRLVYALDGDIYLAEADGTDPARIAGGPSDGAPATCDGYEGDGLMWAPDGRHLAYRTHWDDDCPGRVIVADAAGQVVASVPGSGWLVAWAPDSTRFATWDELGRTIAVYGLDGIRQALLTIPPGFVAAGDVDPVWSPDGGGLVVPHGVLIPLDGSNPTRLSPDDPRTSRHFAFAPDGTRAVFTTADEGLVDGSLVVAAADGSDPHRLVPGGAAYSHLVWSPAGDHIAYAAQEGQLTMVWVMELASGEATRTVGVDGPATTTFPIRFSPDGRRLLMALREHGAPGALGSIGVDGSGFTELVAGTDWGDWQPAPTGS